jgi:hypothetical protein
MDSQSGNASVMCQLVSPEGDHLDAPLYLPQNVGPPQLQEIVNHLLHNVHTVLPRLFFLGHYLTTHRTYCVLNSFQEDKLPYAFYIGDEELSVQLGTYMHQNNGEATHLHLCLLFSWMADNLIPVFHPSFSPLIKPMLRLPCA